MALYEELKGRDIIAAVEPLLKQGILELRHSDGKIVPRELRHTYATPWLHHRCSYRHNCFIWKDIVFDNIVTRVLPQGKRFVPSSCMNCYKVVVRPKNLKQLFQLATVQYGLDHASKCGLETRYTVFGMYGGYFYNRGLEEGLQCYKMVRDAVNAHLGEDVKVLLKRSCTEMEHGVGPSDQWEITPEQEHFEKLIKSKFAMDIPILDQQPHLKDHVQRRWIEEAYKLGDETVWEFIDGPLYPEYVTYHGEIT